MTQIAHAIIQNRAHTRGRTPGAIRARDQSNAPEFHAPQEVHPENADAPATIAPTSVKCLKTNVHNPICALIAATNKKPSSSVKENFR